MLAYVDYSNGQKPLANGKSDSFNQFSLTRGSINIKKQVTPWFGVRYTPDITQDSNGNWMFRTKYLYGEFKPGDLGFLTDLKSEVGMDHVPWLDFEESGNGVERCQVCIIALFRLFILNGKKTENTCRWRVLSCNNARKWR